MQAHCGLDARIIAATEGAPLAIFIQFTEHLSCSLAAARQQNVDGRTH